MAHRDGLTRWAEKTGAAIQEWVNGGGVERLATSIKSLVDAGVSLVDKLGGIENAAKLVAIAMGVNTAVAAVELGSNLVSLSAAIAQTTIKLAILAATKTPLGVWAIEWVKYLWMMRASIMSGLLPSLGAAISATWAWTAALLANPVTWIVLAVVGLIVALVALYKNWDKVSAWIKEKWGKVSQAALEKFVAFRAGVIDAWDSIVAKFKAVYAQIKPVIDKLMPLIEYSPLGLALKGGKFALDAAGITGGGTPDIGASLATPSPTSSAAKITVDFNNAPRGTRVTPERGNTADLDYKLGQSMRDP